MGCRFARCLTVAMAVVAFNASVFAGVIRHDVSDSAYLSLAQDPRYDSVGRITLLATDGNNYAGSGTLINSSWVLTAGHVVADAQNVSFHIGGSTYNAASWVVHPNYSSSYSYDLALVKLDTSLSITPATRYTGSSELGQVGTFVGYGTTGTGLTGGTTYDAQKRAGQNMIDVRFADSGGPKNWRVYGSDFDSPDGTSSAFGSSSALAMEYLISFGDSGGGMFIESGGNTYLAGVHSFLVNADGNNLWADYGDYTGGIRVSVFNSWIDSVLGGGSGGGGGKGGGKPPKGSGAFAYADFHIPEPASFSVLLLGAAILVRRSR